MGNSTHRRVPMYACCQDSSKSVILNSEQFFWPSNFIHLELQLNFSVAMNLWYKEVSHKGHVSDSEKDQLPQFVSDAR